MKRLFIIAGIVVGVLVVCALLVPVFVNADSFRPELEKRLSAGLNRPVHIGKLDASVFSGGASAQDFSVADDPSFSKGPFLKASSLKVGLRMIPLIFSKRLEVTSVTVQKPEIVLLRNAAGKWNYSSLGAAPNANTKAPKPGSAAPDVSDEQ